MCVGPPNQSKHHKSCNASIVNTHQEVPTQSWFTYSMKGTIVEEVEQGLILKGPSTPQSINKKEV